MLSVICTAVASQQADRKAEPVELKGKKKKKAAKATTKEEEDLDAILAELGMATPSASQPQPTAVDDAQVQEGSVAANANAEVVGLDGAEADSKARSRMSS